MNLTLLLTDTFTANVWKEYVEINLYRADLMHTHRQGSSAGECIDGEPEGPGSYNRMRLQKSKGVLPHGQGMI